MARQVTLKGQPVELEGQELKPGMKAPEAILKKTLAEWYKLNEGDGRVRLISVVPSLDTPVCAAKTKRFNEEVSKFMAWQRSRGAVPTVVALRQRFESIRRSELQRLEGKLGALSPDARARVDEVTRLIVEKLLLEPTEQLKALPDEETQAAYTEAVNRLFRLRDDAASDAAEGSTDPAPADRRHRD